MDSHDVEGATRSESISHVSSSRPFSAFRRLVRRRRFSFVDQSVSDLELAQWLASLGLTGNDQTRARTRLEEAGFTNPRKTRISVAKLERAATAIDEVFARHCASCASRTDPAGREVVVVVASACSRCGGSRNDRALTELAEACAAAGLRRLAVVGGSPDTRREFDSLSGTLELRLIDGTKRRTRAEAQRDLAWADLVVIGGSSELGHKVSNLYTQGRTGTPVITASRRGVEAISATVVEHLRRRR